MPRDASGNFTLVAGNPVVPGTVIEADWANPTMSDIAAALTDSLSRTGSGGMLVPFKNADGTMIAPGLSWVNEPTSGWYRAALNDFWYSVGNENIFRITKAGIELAGGKTALGIASSTVVADAEPPGLSQGEEWFESDTGGFYMRYVNPDATETLIALGITGGDFIPFAMKGAANGVAELDATGKVPPAQIPSGVPGGVATLDGTGKVPLAQLPTPPSGTIFDFAGTVVPAGYLACDGAAVSRATFADLFAAIGVAWGVGDGVTTFNVPNLARRVTVGSGGAGTATLGNAVGNTGGEEAHVQTLAELVSHTHPFHSETPQAGGDGSGATPNNTGTILNTNPTGGGAAFNVMQPSAVVLKLIKT